MPRVSNARERLIESAVELIHSRSYESVGVNAICDEAGVKKGSFYHFFPSKRDLTLAALDAMVERHHREIFDPALKPDIPPLDRFDRFFEAVRRDQREWARDGHVCGCQIGNLASELSTQDEAIRGRVEDAFQTFEAAIEVAVRDVVGSNPGVDAATTAQALFAYLQGVLLLAKTYNDPDLLVKLAPGARLLATGIG